MIKINLVSKQAASTGGGGIVFADGGSGDSSEAQIQKQGALRLAILFLGPVLLWVYQQTVIPELQTKRSQLLSEIESLREFNRGAERSVNEIKRFKEDEERIQARIAYLDGISKNRNREIKIIELIQQVIPEKSWLNRLEFNGGKVNLGGMAMSDYDVSTFMEGLSKSVHFQEVNLLSSSEVTYDGLQLKSFEITGTVESPR